MVVGTGDRSMRARMRQAGTSGARLAVILGDDELREQQATVKNLAGGEQQDGAVRRPDDLPGPDRAAASDIEQEAAL